jgi:putative flippase GtrA
MSEVFRYLFNGLICTIVHFAVLTFNIKILHFESSGLANFIASFFGITLSFIGSRYFVFPNRKDFLARQLIKFGFLYGLIAIFHGLILFLWTDKYGFDYHIGFIVATIFQVSFSFLGNKFMVFNK